MDERRLGRQSLDAHPLRLKGNHLLTKIHLSRPKELVVTGITCSILMDLLFL